MKKNSKGFTLVELIVVIAIVGILAAILVPTLVGYVRDAREKAAVAEAKQIMNASQIALTVTDSTYSVNNSKLYKTADNKWVDCGCITNWAVAKALTNGTDDKIGTRGDINTAYYIMKNLDSEELKNSLFGFSGQVHNPIGDNCQTFTNTYKCPGIITVYSAEGGVEILEYLNKGILVHYENGEYTTTQVDSSTKFIGTDRINYNP